VLSCLAIFTATPASAATSFSDGSFESPVVTPNTFQTFFAGASIGPWTVTQGSVDLIGQGWWQAADGVQSLDLDGDQQGAVAQTFSTLPLLKYEVSFKLAGNTGSGPTVKTGQVLVNGQVVKEFSFDITGKTPSNMGYVSQEFTFLASGSSTTLEFASTTPGAFGPVIDKVEVESCLLILCP
jgi:choice-of-anchor C domain-containing protein